MKYSIRYLGKQINVDASSWISRKAKLKITGGGSITIGKNCEIHGLTMILTYGGHITIGDNCSLNPFSIIYGHAGVKIGSEVRIAAHTVVIPANHNPGNDNLPLTKSGLTLKGIEIGNNVWIGTGCRILDGVVIGRNTIIGAGSVVTKSIPANSKAVGIPARII